MVVVILCFAASYDIRPKQGYIVGEDETKDLCGEWFNWLPNTIFADR